VRSEGTLGEMHIAISSDGDLLIARQQARMLATSLGFTVTEVVGIVTAVSEMARNMLMYAGRGVLQVQPVEAGERRGLTVIARYEGPGIPDVHKAMLDGYSTSGGLGMGLPGIRRLMDDFEIESEPRKGTTVTARKWRNHH
jgi:serine/threonine-protein kinase RsbT